MGSIHLQIRGVVLFRHFDGREMGAAHDMRELRSGRIADLQLYPDDIEHSRSKTVLRRFIESIPTLGLFLAF